MGFKLEHKLSAATTSITEVLDDLMEEMAQRHCRCGDLNEIRLALQEALNNALSHGSEMDPQKVITVETRCDDKEGLHIVVRDEGPGFAPENVPDPTENDNIKKPGGRGLYLMQQLMDEVEFRDHGREVHLRRRPRTPEKPA